MPYTCQRHHKALLLKVIKFMNAWCSRQMFNRHLHLLLIGRHICSAMRLYGRIQS